MNEEIKALIAYLKTLEDPTQTAMPAYGDVDWRGLAGACHRALTSLAEAQLSEARQRTAELGLTQAPQRVRINPTHEAADAFWKHWRENGETHKHGYYESTWGAINAALKVGGIR